MMDISTPYYEDLTRISNSNIGWFLNKGPAYLHTMLTNPPPEEKNPTLERGTMIHEYLLQPEEFQKDYVVWNKAKPSSTQQEKFCQEFINSIELEPNKRALSAYKKAYSTKGKSEDLMLSEGLKMASELSEYIGFLGSGDKRIMISPYDVKILEKIKQNVISHKLAANLLWPRNSRIRGLDIEEFIPETGDSGISPITNYHEFHINWKWYGDEPNDDYPHVDCKSLLDSLTLDFKNKKVTIMDLKTTAKLWHFEESIEMYDYCRQLAYYTMAVKWYMFSELGIKDLNEWTFEYYIIGIDTTGSYEIRVFDIPESIVKSRDIVIHTALQEIMWHQQNDKWDHSRAYYEGNGSETLNL